MATFSPRPRDVIYALNQNPFTPQDIARLGDVPLDKAGRLECSIWLEFAQEVNREIDVACIAAGRDRYIQNVHRVFSTNDDLEVLRCASRAGNISNTIDGSSSSITLDIYMAAVQHVEDEQVQGQLC